LIEEAERCQTMVETEVGNVKSKLETKNGKLPSNKEELLDNRNYMWSRYS
jgi:hypothetical protein